MGIIDLHFHDSKVEFAPHIGPKETVEGAEGEGSGATPAGTGSGTSVEDRAESDSSGLASSTAARGIGALIALAFLVGIGVLVRKVGGGEEAPVEESAESEDEGPTSIDVSED